MTPLEACTVTALGMFVVFIGLMLCILFINAFNRVAKHVKWGDGNEHGHAPPAPKPAEVPNAEPVRKAKAQPVVAPTPEVLAVIAAAVEIELRLFGSHTTQKLTIRRTHG